jgi:transcriptional regulator with XRE-family HTH domain
MPRRNRASRAGARMDGRRLAQAKASELGAAVRTARKRRRWSQAGLGRKVDLAQSRIAQLELKPGAGTSFEVWFALASALRLPLRVEFGRDPVQEPDDAGHLKVQELMLRLGRLAGRQQTMELPTRPANPRYSIDVCTRDDRLRVLFIEECWNTFGNINEAVRSTRRKVAEAQQLAVAIGGETGPYRVAAAWIVRDTRRNREILARYPEVFAAAFTGSSRQWVTALTTTDARPPTELGLVWCDRKATRLVSWRKA